MDDVDVVVIGAGMAGLTAARVLCERGERVVVLEARERVGGRVLSVVTAGGGVAELGAEFVHGRVKELWDLIDEAGVETVERAGRMLSEQEDGGVAEDEEREEGDLFAPLEGLEGMQGADVSFAKWLEGSDVPEEQRAALTGYVEGFNAADATKISTRALGVQQAAEDASEGDRAWHVVGGYTQLAEFLAGKVRAAGGEIRLGSEVLAVRWSEGVVEVETAQGTVRAKRCVVTLPLGVLQRVNREGGMMMEPEPRAVGHARRMVMGQAERFTMVFRERWWERAGGEGMSFLFTPRRKPAVWWTMRPEDEAMPTLTGWAGGPGAAEGAGAESAAAALAEVFGVSVAEQLVEIHAHDWGSDPYALGAYSYVPVGALDASAAMAEPEAGTMFFAGEHTDVTGHWGTVQATVRSGLRVGAECREGLYSSEL